MISSAACAASSLLAQAPCHRCAAPSQEDVRLHHQVAAREDVVEDRHALEEREALEGARDAALGAVARVHVRAGLAAEGDAPLLRAVDAVDHVQHRALAGAVGADDGAHLVLAHVEAHLGERLHAAEGERHVLDREDHLAHLARRELRLGIPQVHAAARTAGSAQRPRRVEHAAPRGPCRCARPRSARPTTQRSESGKARRRSSYFSSLDDAAAYLACAWKAS